MRRESSRGPRPSAPGTHTGLAPRPDSDTPFAPPCLSLDLEVGTQDARIHAFGAVRPDTDQRLVFSGGNLTTALAQLDELAQGANFLLGHNLITFDLPHLTAAKPDMRLLQLPAVDTLWLNPLAFPRNPYHHLVKHYQDGQLTRGRLNDPELDARLALDVFRDQCQALRKAPPDLLLVWHWLTTADKQGPAGFNRIFSALRRVRRPSDSEARAAIRKRLEGRACLTHARAIMRDAAQLGWPLAYALAWLSVAGSNSVMPPWVRHQFPAAGRLVRRLRGTACPDPACTWCRERHDARKELTRWFGFAAFRSKPAQPDGRPMQQTIVEAALAGTHVLGILPTGTGKSLCYQIPALSQYDKTGGKKLAHIHQVLLADLPPNTPGGAIVYCATRRRTEEVAEFLQYHDVAADFFHAKLPPETKKSVQQRFIGGALRVIAATNAFGMGIDKPDVRLVIHADIPGSLENYLQEAGRAGRDQQTARCLDRKKRLDGEVVATAGEILTEDEDKEFERDAVTDDTRVRTAVAWLEDATLLTREENRVQVFPSSLRIKSLEEARARLARHTMTDAYRRQLLAVTARLIDADPDDGISTDELLGVSGLRAEEVRSVLYDLERHGIASNDTVLTAFVHTWVERSSQKRFEEAASLETALIDHLRLAAPDLSKGDTSLLHLRVAAQILRDADIPNPLPERLWRILRSLAFDGRGEGGDAGSLAVRKRDAETVQVTLLREWQTLEEMATRRRAAAKQLLEHLLTCLPSGSRGTDLLTETTLGRLLATLTADPMLKSRSKRPEKLLERALLWLHEQEVIHLHRGLAIFRQAMTIRLAQEQPRRGFAKADFEPLRLYYDGRVRQVHVMMEFARRGLDTMAEALQLAMDYFCLQEEEFLRRWLPDRAREIARETTPESWRAIVESLRNPTQRQIVTDEREQNVLVLAGPGSGKTRVLVHRIAYLVRVRRERPRGILALAYNRHAAVEIRRRLADLIGDEARGVTVLTCHALAMRLVGASFTARAERPGQEVFREVMRQAITLLRGEGLPPEDADEQRERLLTGFRWILVDEYQDIDAEQYALIAALAGRTLEDEDRKLTLFAVGNDDQNIYAFNGASVEFIRRFEADYGPKPAFLTDNYRSTGHIIAAANAWIAPARQRMKTDHPIGIDRARAKEAPGGVWEKRDPVAHGRESRFVDTAALCAWLEACSPGPWITLLQEAVDDCALETGGATMPVSHCIEWLAEWGRKVRQRQRGLLLLTAHSAKGLEFDHVAVLDGGWGRSNRDEDPDAARRLYYVAMTRARQTLTLARFTGHPPRGASKQLYPLSHAFPDSHSVLRRTADGSVSRASVFARQYRRPGLDEIYLGFAGRYPVRHPVHRAIAALSPGDPLTVRVEKSGRWALLNRAGTVVGRLAKGFEPPGRTRCSSASVLAIVAWSRDASEPGYQDRVQCDEWEVVVPELVFEPHGRTSR